MPKSLRNLEVLRLIAGSFKSLEQILVSQGSAFNVLTVQAQCKPDSSFVELPFMTDAEARFCAVKFRSLRHFRLALQSCKSLRTLCMLRTKCPHLTSLDLELVKGVGDGADVRDSISEYLSKRENALSHRTSRNIPLASSFCRSFLHKDCVESLAPMHCSGADTIRALPKGTLTAFEVVLDDLESLVRCDVTLLDKLAVVDHRTHCVSMSAKYISQTSTTLASCQLPHLAVSGNNIAESERIATHAQFLLAAACIPRLEELEITRLIVSGPGWEIQGLLQSCGGSLRRQALTRCWTLAARTEAIARHCDRLEFLLLWDDKGFGIPVEDVKSFEADVQTIATVNGRLQNRARFVLEARELVALRPRARKKRRIVASASAGTCRG
jgi:hypothetical protein